MSSTDRTVWAAGGVLWRRGAAGKREVAIVHRRRYDDWSLPKGKVDDGELLAATAIREIAEETGYSAHLGRKLDTIAYRLKSGVDKRVAYWSMEAADGRFVSNSETDDLQWLSVSGASKTVSYRADRTVLESFNAIPADELHQVIVVRHAKAGRRSRFTGNDCDRPLDREGRAQAQALAHVLALYGARHLYAADRLRCRATLEPLAAQLRTDVISVPELSEEAFADSPKAAFRRLRELAAPSDGVSVICSQGKVIPPLLQRWAERDDVALPPSRNRKGSFWVLTVRGDTLVQVDHQPSPLPGKNGH